MASESQQTKLTRVRKPRVHITYEVETEGAQVVKELPFVVGVMGDFSGDPTEKLKPLKDRKFIQIDRDNFNDVLKRMTPGLNMRVENTLADDGSEMSVNLQFEKMEDFEPANVVNQVDPLKKLMETRDKLRDLATKIDRSDDLETVIEQVLSNTDQLQKLSGEPGVDESGEPAFDLTHLGEDTIMSKLPFVRELAKTYVGVDPVHEPIPIRPVVHYMMGGIDTDITAATNIPGLFAAGEVACASLNGANRLGSNSLTECLVELPRKNTELSIVAGKRFAACSTAARHLLRLSFKSFAAGSTKATSPETPSTTRLKSDGVIVFIINCPDSRSVIDCAHSKRSIQIPRHVGHHLPPAAVSGRAESVSHPRPRW